MKKKGISSGTVKNISLEAIFSENGLLSKGFARYESRPQQLTMALAIRDSLRGGKHLIVEAGTGVGKSLAYLVPFILRAEENSPVSGEGPAEKKRALISTYTKTLQEQLVNKDLPLLEDILPFKFKFSLCVGSENYLCRRRLNQVWQYGLFDSQQESRQLAKIADWNKSTDTGLRFELPFEPEEKVWMKLCREADLCLGKKCRFNGDCFFAKAKIEQSEADILVVNHHLFFANIASGGKALPSYDAVVFDEAQNLEEVAGEYLGIEVSNYGIRRLLDSIYNQNTDRGLLNRIRGLDHSLKDTLTVDIQQVRLASDEFFTGILDEFGVSGTKTILRRMHGANLFENNMEQPLKDLSEKLKLLLDTVSEDELRIEISAYSNRLAGIKNALDVFIKHSYADYVYFLEISSRARYLRICLHGVPVDIAGIMKEKVLDATPSVIFTSATLSVYKSFGYIRERLGLGEAEELLLDSPFDYEKQALLYIAGGLPDPSYRTAEFQEQAIKRIDEILKISGGHTFVLFTSYDTLEKAYARLKNSSETLHLIKQGDLPRWQMLEDFKIGSNTVLLGTNTFWQGVDVPGCALQCVIIFKLPFSVPDNPVTEAKMEYLTKKGRDPFLHYQVPQSIIMLKQGFGRLIRTKNDRGIVAILDPRIKTRHYGRLFLESLPNCRVTEEIEEIAEKLKSSD